MKWKAPIKFPKIIFGDSHNSNISYRGVCLAHNLISQTQSCILFIYLFFFFILRGKKNERIKKSQHKTVNHFTCGKSQNNVHFVATEKCRMGYFCAHWRNINLQKIFHLSISCILSIWYIKFIYNKLENKFTLN